MNPKSIPTLRGSKLCLRPLETGDREAFHALFNQSGIMDYFPKPGPVSEARIDRIIAAQLKHWEAHQCGWWGVEDPISGELVGWCGLQVLPETHETEVAFMISQQRQRQGLATEAARMSLVYGFENLDVKEIIGIVHKENTASQKALEKSGLHSRTSAAYFEMNCWRYVIRQSDQGINQHLS